MKKTLFLTGIFYLMFCLLALAALDLRFTTDITITPNSPAAGNSVTFSVNWKNFGAAVDNMNIRGGVDGATILNYTYPHLDSGVPQESKSFNWTATAGTHTVWFELDPAHTCGDSNYSNNRVEKSFTVSGSSDNSGQPDLAPVVVFSPVKFRENDEVKFSIIIYNSGNKTSKNCEMQVKQNGVVIDTKTIPTVVPASSNISNNHWHLTYNWKALCGAVVEFVVDSNNLNSESNETNNSWSNQMKCRFTVHDFDHGLSTAIREDPNGPDLTVKIIKIYKSPYDASGQTAIVEWEVSNIGKAKSVPCQMTAKRGGVDEMYFDIPALDPGQKFARDYAEELVCAQETSLHVDVDKKNIESDENNNVAKKKIVCLSNK